MYYSLKKKKNLKMYFIKIYIKHDVYYTIYTFILMKKIKLYKV